MEKKTNTKLQEQIKCKSGKNFSWEEREKIVKEYLSSDATKREIWEKYTGQSEERGQLLRWMRKLGYSNIKMKGIKPGVTSMLMGSIMEGGDFESKVLKKRVSELEKQLKDAEMKILAFSTMVEIAEKELNISIKQKYSSHAINY